MRQKFPLILCAAVLLACAALLAGCKHESNPPPPKPQTGAALILDH